MSISFKKGHGLDVMGLRKHIHRGDVVQVVAAGDDLPQVAGLGGGIAGDGDDLPGCEFGQKRRRLAQSLAGRIKEDAVKAGAPFDHLPQLRLDIADMKTTGGQTGLNRVAASPVDAAPVMLDAGDAGPAQGQGDGEVAHAAEEIQGKAGGWNIEILQGGGDQLQVLLHIDLEKAANLPVKLIVVLK